MFFIEEENGFPVDAKLLNLSDKKRFHGV